MKLLSHTYTLYKRIIPTFFKLKDKNNSISWREKRLFYFILRRKSVKFSIV